MPALGSAWALRGPGRSLHWRPQGPPRRPPQDEPSTFSPSATHAGRSTRPRRVLLRLLSAEAKRALRGGLSAARVRSAGRAGRPRTRPPRVTLGLGWQQRQQRQRLFSWKARRLPFLAGGSNSPERRNPGSTRGCGLSTSLPFPVLRGFPVGGRGRARNW